ncbi:MAG: hypothetical protein ACE3L7_07580 [Candidatus Pristimantibacillus sp.]
MSVYAEFQEEKERIDSYISRQFRICNVTEGLSGSTVELKQSNGESVTLLVLSADARKYLSNVLIKQIAMEAE